MPKDNHPNIVFLKIWWEIAFIVAINTVLLSLLYLKKIQIKKKMLLKACWYLMTSAHLPAQPVSILAKTCLQ
jgi:hypothetical protein